MLPTPAADRAMAMHRFEQALSRAIAGGQQCPEPELHEVLKTLFQIHFSPRTHGRLGEAVRMAIDRIVRALPPHKRREAAELFKTVRQEVIGIPGSSLSSVN